MKKIMLLALFILNMGLAFAQTHVLVNARHLPENIFKQMPSDICQNTGRQKVTPRQVAANQRCVGAYLGDDYALQGYGLPDYPGQLRVATLIPKFFFRQYEGCQMTGLRAAISQKLDKMRFFVAPVDNNGNILDEIATAVCYGCNFGWNEVAITPFTIDTENILGYAVGYEYTQINERSVYNTYAAECYPISVYESDQVLPMLIYGDLSYGSDWYSVETGDATMSMQCIVSSDQFVPKDISLVYLGPDNLLVKNSDETYGNLVIHNFSAEGEATYSIDVMLDGKTFTTLSDDLEWGETDLEDFKLPLSWETTSGKHKLTARLTQIDGSAPAERTYHEISCDLGVYSNDDIRPRQRYVIEELTSTASRYAPLGTKVLTAMERNFDDFDIVSLHESYTGTDTLTVDEMRKIIDLLNWKTTPSVALNRIYLDDDIENGFYEISAATGYDTSYPTRPAKQLHELMVNNSLDALATLDIKADINDGQLTVNVTGQGADCLQDIFGDNMCLTVYVTEDNIVAPQQNGNSVDESFVHNNVVRSVLSDVYGDKLNWTASDTFAHDYTLSLPNHWKPEQLRVTALIHLLPLSIAFDYSNMQVSNASSVRPQVSSGIMQTASVNIIPVAIYDVNGVRHSTLQKGINLVRMSNGQTRKVICN